MSAGHARRAQGAINFARPQLDDLPLHRGAGTRKGVEGTNAPVDGLGRKRPIHCALGFLDLVGITHPRLRLRHRHQPPGVQLVQRLNDEPPTLNGQAVVQGGCGVLGQDIHRVAQQHVASVQARIHLHDGDAGLRIT